MSWNKGLTSRRVPTWSWFGTAIHAGLESWYIPGKKRGGRRKMLAAFDEALDGETRRIYTDGGEISEDEIVDGRALGHAMLLGYIDHFGQDTEWEVIHSEQSFQIDVPGVKKKDPVLAIYCGTWDSLWRNRRTKELWLVDHKTRRSFPQNWSFYNINDQAGSYLWVAPEVLVAMGVLSKKDKIEGLIFNALRKHLPDERPRNSDGECLNKDGSVSKRQPAPLYHREEIYRSPEERVKQAKRVQGEALVMSKMRSGEIPVFKNPTENCVRCQYFEVCELDEWSEEEGRELARSVLMKRDPYKTHTEAMARGGVTI